MGVKFLDVCPLKAWQAAGAKWMEHQRVKLEVLEPFARYHSPFQASWKLIVQLWLACSP